MMLERSEHTNEGKSGEIMLLLPATEFAPVGAALPKEITMKTRNV